MAQIWNADNTNLDKDVEQQEHLFIAGNKTIATEDNWTVSYETKHILTI